MGGFMSLKLILATILATTFTRYRSCSLVQDIYVPTYAYPCSGTPGCAWDVFKNGSTLVIINPNSGPDSTSNSDFVNLVNTVKTNSTVKTVLGYVLTGYGNRSPSDVTADINSYYSFYNIDGIFLDEGSTSCDNTNISNYKSYDALVKSKAGAGFTVLNWGTQGPECYLKQTTINSFVIYESYFSNYSSTGAPLAYMSSYDATKFWIILHTAPTNATAVRAAVAQSKTRNVGHVYITDATLPNPYNVSPSTTVWQAEKTKAAMGS